MIAISIVHWGFKPSITSGATSTTGLCIEQPSLNISNWGYIIYIDMLHVCVCVYIYIYIICIFSDCVHAFEFKLPNMELKDSTSEKWN